MLAISIEICPGVRFKTNECQFKVQKKLDNDVFIVKEMTVSGVERQMTLEEILRCLENSIVYQMDKPERPLQRVRIEHTPIDVRVVHPETREVISRTWLTYVIDCYSAEILGFHVSFESPSYKSVLEALKHAIFPKNYVKEKYPKIKNEYPTCGLPELLITDNGKEFSSDKLNDACNQLGIILYQCPTNSHLSKGMVERGLRTITTFTNSEKKAAIGFNVLIELIHLWIIDGYSQRYHVGLNGIPCKIWDNAIKLYGSPRIPENGNLWGTL